MKLVILSNISNNQRRTTKHEEDGTDIAAVRANRISITPVTFEMTHKNIMAELEHEFCQGGKCDWYGYNAYKK
jgi:broad specificity polyphosphatase/5'/3'-nucleotidase SurE